MTWPFQAHLPPGWWVRSTFLRTTLLPGPGIGPVAETYSVRMTFVLGSDHRVSTWG